MSQDLDAWLIDLPKRMQQFSIIFLQLGHAMEPVRSAVRNVAEISVSASDLLDVDGLGNGELIIVEDLEQLATNRGDRLGSLRERLMRETGYGRRFALVSKSPKTAYPVTVGSDVVSDAKQVFAPNVAHADSECPEDQHYEICVKELGDRTLMALSTTMWDFQSGPGDALRSLSKPDVEALRGAGLVSVDADVLNWEGGGNYKKLRMAVALVSAETVTARTSVPDTFSELWILERVIRNVVRRALVARMGDSWRVSCLEPHLRANVLERAQKDSQPGAIKMTDLRDPLEWLTTTELLDLRSRHELGDLGLAPYLWLKLRNEILPIRNRIAHMRIVSDDDARTVRTWRNLVARKLH